MAFPSVIQQSAEAIRDWGRQQIAATVLTSPASRAKFASALDVLVSTDLALEAFLNVHPDIEVEDTSGDAFLAAYGALQAMYLQQDALRSLFVTLGRPFELSPGMRDIRDIRNDSSGHPTDRGRDTSFHSIGPFSVSRRGFQLMSVSASGEPEFRMVDLFHLASTQLRETAALLLALRSALEGEPVSSGGA